MFIIILETRKLIDLESHWNKKERPAAQYSANKEIYEQNFIKLLEEYPCPDEYLNNSLDSNPNEDNLIKKL